MINTFIEEARMVDKMWFAQMDRDLDEFIANLKQPLPPNS